MGGCQNGVKENVEAYNGMADYFQRIKDGRDEDVVFFPEDADQRAATDHKWLKSKMENLMREAL
jgi:hypothetical protein